MNKNPQCGKEVTFELKICWDIFCLQENLQRTAGNAPKQGGISQQPNLNGPIACLSPTRHQEMKEVIKSWKSYERVNKLCSWHGRLFHWSSQVGCESKLRVWIYGFTQRPAWKVSKGEKQDKIGWGSTTRLIYSIIISIFQFCHNKSSELKWWSYQTWSPPAWRQPWQIWRPANSKWRQRPSRHPSPSLPQSCCLLPLICPHNCHPPPRTFTVTNLWPFFCGSWDQIFHWPNFSLAHFFCDKIIHRPDSQLALTAAS